MYQWPFWPIYGGLTTAESGTFTELLFASVPIVNKPEKVVAAGWPWNWNPAYDRIH